MLRHHDITDDDKLMALANLLQNLEEEIARVGCAEKGTALITACGDKVRVSSAVEAVQVCWH